MRPGDRVVVRHLSVRQPETPLEVIERAQAESSGETAAALPAMCAGCVHAAKSAAEERRSILHETGSTVTRACAALVRLSAPDDVDDAYVPRAAVVDIAMGLKRDMDALRSRAAAWKEE